MPVYILRNNHAQLIYEQILNVYETYDGVKQISFVLWLCKFVTLLECMIVLYHSTVVIFFLSFYFYMCNINL